MVDVAFPPNVEVVVSVMVVVGASLMGMVAIEVL